MAEVNFRAWDKDGEYMEYTDRNLIVSFGDNGNVDATDLSNIYSTCNGMQNFELMQSTGLKDKNGVEIYEGDIIKHKELPNPFFKPPFEVIQARTGEWRLDSFRGGTVLAFCRQEELKIIGNIYENPELLEDE